MLLIHESHVFKLRVERKFEMCYPWSNHNATSVLQRRKPGKIEKEKKKTKNKTVQSHGKLLLLSDQIFFVKQMFSFSPPQKKTKQDKTKQNKKGKTIQNKT